MYRLNELALFATPRQYKFCPFFGITLPVIVSIRVHELKFRKIACPLEPLIDS